MPLLRTVLIVAAGLLGLDVLGMGVVGVVGLVQGPLRGSLTWSIAGDAARILLGGGLVWAAWVSGRREVVSRSGTGRRSDGRR